MSTERNLAQRTQRVIHQLAERIDECGRVANELSGIIDDLALGAPVAVQIERAAVESWTLGATDVRSLTEAALIANAEICRRVTVHGFWTDQVEQRALLRWLVKTLLLADPQGGEPAGPRTD